MICIFFVTLFGTNFSGFFTLFPTNNSSILHFFKGKTDFHYTFWNEFFPKLTKFHNFGKNSLWFQNNLFPLHPVRI